MGVTFQNGSHVFFFSFFFCANNSQLRGHFAQKYNLFEILYLFFFACSVPYSQSSDVVFFSMCRTDAV